LAHSSDVTAHEDIGFGGRVLPTEQPSSALRSDHRNVRERRYAALAVGHPSARA
jgi:hypothetical protein